ncbi:cystathionine gamma-lyase [Capsaspora owczarzaki ATCC 30864]|uniref:cystathionine gamma-lyase n=1 Tax=Capsaspora owczarzaki (strain ATCC 30864) TaxID=595528 RepID=A0A0D2X0T7_CAPO3|nr:cystathionine gamma-lyase [Capsaspora owczarzaki ATCC 30864]KJE89629.1 cystathionine gamma-lyase [Capsaspora owczarzaki ATCC 30864]|eukprot:XP_004365936.2 cystathionine gamma-lyase [Capsaspora owczarzaki ATCC 30864]
MSTTPLAPFKHFATDAIHAGQEADSVTGAVVVPLSLATTYKQDAPAQHRGFEYSRSGNPTRNAYEACIAKLEVANHGFAFSSGLAATATITHLLAAGDHLICMNDVYGGTNRYFNKVATRDGIQVSMVDLNNEQALRAAIKPNTKLVWIESPTNPTLKLVDIAAVSKIVHEHAGIIVVVDNTFMSSYFQRPLTLGADIVMHSVTKYMNGHSDAVFGVVCCRDDAIAERLRYYQNSIGGVPSPFDCYLALRGVKTLAVRMKAHMSNALAIAKFLENSDRVDEVIYPGLPSHPQHELANRQCSGYTGVVSFRIKGDMTTSKKFFEKIHLFTLAESLGAVESLAELPAIMTHASVSAEERAKLGISDTLIRLSVGIEDEEDLVEDLRAALAYAVSDELAKKPKQKFVATA